MKEKVPKIEGRKIHDYTFKFEKKEYLFSIQEPTFEQLSASMGELYDQKGLRLELAGKVIWELCCVSYDPVIDSNPKILMTICTRLSEYVLPLDLEIKKK